MPRPAESFENFKADRQTDRRTVRQTHTDRQRRESDDTDADIRNDEQRRDGGHQRDIRKCGS